MTPLTRLTTVFLACGLPAISARAIGQQRDAPLDSTTFRPYQEHIAGTLVSLEMLPVPGGRVQPAGAGGPPAADVGPFWMSQTEVTWDAYDVFAFGLDQADSTGGADAVTRPTRPYVLPGEQFGHRGHPAIGITYYAAQMFADWLSAKTEKRYRLPTAAEWEHACRLGRSEVSQAWHAENAGERTHAVATLARDALGLYDVLGNVGEWVITEGRQPTARGGAFMDDARGVNCAASTTQTPAWNATDPQLPKSRWWLTDAPFVGFRLVREP